VKAVHSLTCYETSLFTFWPPEITTVIPCVCFSWIRLGVKWRGGGWRGFSCK